MSILNNIKKAFGFSDGIAETDIDSGFSPYAESPQRTPYINPFKKEVTPTVVPAEDKAAEKPATVVAEATENGKFQLPNDFLNSIIEIVNANLPQIVKECVDIEAEKKALSHTFGAHFQAAMKSVHQAALEEAKVQWEADRDTFNAKIAELGSTIDESERRTGEARQKLLVEETKRKAIATQAEELQKRVQTLEAEHEQYIIENKSLQNKMKVMQVYADDAKAYKEQLDERDSLIKKLNESIAATEKTAADALAEIERLNAELKDANANLEIASELEKQLEQVDTFKEKKNTELKAFKEQLDELRDAYDKLKLEKENFSLQMKSAADSNAELSDNIQQMKSEHEATISRMKAEREAEVQSLTEERDNAQKQLTEEKSTHRSDNAYFEQKIKFLEAEQKRKVMELNDEIKRLNEKQPSISLAEIDDDIKDAVNETFDINVSEPAAPAYDMFANDSFSDDNIDATFDNNSDEEPVAADANIEVIEKPAESPAASEPADKAVAAGSDKKVSAIDEMDDIDWLMPTPPTPVAEPEPAFVPAEADDEPKHGKTAHTKQQQEPDSKQQMSLF